METIKSIFTNQAMYSGIGRIIVLLFQTSLLTKIVAQHLFKWQNI